MINEIHFQLLRPSTARLSCVKAIVMSRHSFILAVPRNSSPIAGPRSYRYANRRQLLPQQWVARGCMSIGRKVAPLAHLFSEFKSFSIKVFGFLFIPPPYLLPPVSSGSAIHPILQ